MNMFFPAILYLCSFLLVSAVYKDSIPKYFPAPPPNGNRTAILISGQLRSGNVSFMSGMVAEQRNAHYFGGDDPPTPIRTCLEWLIAPLAKAGGVDLFIYIPVDRNTTYNKNWDGNPATYEPYPGDPKACELYSQSPIFQEHTGNKVFCLIEFEKELTDEFIYHYDFWGSYFFPHSNAKEVFLQQEYGKYRANFAAKEYALLKNFQYTYKVRLRPDLAMVKPLPPLDKLTFRDPNSKDCPSTVYFPNGQIFYISGEDSFNIGYAEDVDKVLDRYIDLIAKPFIQSNYGRSRSWSSESNLQAILKQRYNICLISYFDIWMAKMRVIGYNKDTFIKKPARIRFDWLQMPSAVNATER